MPQVMFDKGPVLATPRLVAVTFANDDPPTVNAIDTFVRDVGATPYWMTTAGIYGVGPATGVSFHSPESPSGTIDDTAVQAWVTTLFNRDAGFTASANDVYLIFYSTSVTITYQGGTVCTPSGPSGYHSQTQLSDGTPISYAVIGRCENYAANYGGIVNYLTGVGSHEILEAVTDPLAQTSPAYAGVDPNDLAWALSLGGEIGDMCELGTWFFLPSPANFVTPVWSDVAAAGSHQPCVPSQQSVYFNSTPSALEDIHVAANGMSFPTKGLLIPAGTKKTIELDLWSDAPTADLWDVTADDFYALVAGQPSDFSFSFDKTSGRNGDKIQMTIGVAGANAQGEVFVIESALRNAPMNAQPNFWIGMVANQ